MKNKILAATLTATLLSANSFAQWSTSTSTSAIADPGITELKFTPSSGSIRSLRGETDNYVEVYGNHNGDDGPGLFFFNNNYSSPSEKGGVQIWSSSSSGSNTAFQLVNHPPFSSTWTSLLKVKNSGEINLGDISLHPDNGGIRSLRFMASNTNSYTEIYSGYDGASGSGIIMGTPFQSLGNNGGISFWAYNNSSTLDQRTPAFDFTCNDYGGSSLNSKYPLTIRKGGKVVIGEGLNYNSLTVPLSTKDYIPDGYKLFVEEGILTEKVKVALISTTQWADHVFAPSYSLMPLNQVEEFIHTNKHLPDVPSAEELVNSGLDLGKMDAKLMQKIEELTLYTIQLQKEVNELKQKQSK